MRLPTITKNKSNDFFCVRFKRNNKIVGKQLYHAAWFVLNAQISCELTDIQVAFILQTSVKHVKEMYNYGHMLQKASYHAA